MKDQEARLKMAVHVFNEVNHKSMSIIDDVGLKIENAIGVCDAMADNLYRRNIDNKDGEAESMAHVFTQLQNGLELVRILIEDGLKDKYE